MSKNILEQITPEEVLAAHEVKEITPQEWAAALDRCVRDLTPRGKPAAEYMVRRLRDGLKTSYKAPKYAGITEQNIARSYLSEWYPHVLRCYVVRARQAAGVSSHNWPGPADLPPFVIHDTVFVTCPWTTEDAAAAKELLAKRFPSLAWYFAEQRPPAQQPVIPENGHCWVKKLDGTWVIYRTQPGAPFVHSVAVRKVGNCWVGERNAIVRPAHDTLVEAMCSLEKDNVGRVLPKPADENTPWIVLTAEGKLELETAPVQRKATVTLWAGGVQVGHATEVPWSAKPAAPQEEPLKPWKERPEDLYWFRVAADYQLLDRKDPNKQWGRCITTSSGRTRADHEKELGFPPLPVVRTSGYWLLGDDDKYRVTVDGKVYVADGPNHAKRIEKENRWLPLAPRITPYPYVDERIAHDDAKDAEGWKWQNAVSGEAILLFHRTDIMDTVWRIRDLWQARNLLGTREEAMLALEKHYNLPKLNRP